MKVLKLLSYFICVCFASFSPCSVTISDWKPIAPLPEYHVEGASAVVNGKFYLIAGFYTTNLLPGVATNVWDPTTNTWKTKAPLPQATSHGNAATDGIRYIYIAGGYLGQEPGATPTNKVWRYDTLKNKWSSLPPLPKAKAAGGVTLVGNQLHYIGGLINEVDDTANHWVLDVSNPKQWTTATSLPIKRNHFQSVAINGSIYVVGGQVGRQKGAKVDSDLLDAFNITSNTWSSRSKLPEPHSHCEASTIVVYDNIVIIGGKNDRLGYSKENLASSYVYDPAADKWDSFAKLPRKFFSGAAGFLQGVKLYGTKTKGDYIIISGGGFAYNQAQKSSYVAKLTRTCPSSVQLEQEDTLSAEDNEVSASWKLLPSLLATLGFVLLITQK